MEGDKCWDVKSRVFKRKQFKEENKSEHVMISGVKITSQTQN